MASFCREDYKKVYRFAASQYVALRRKKDAEQSRQFAIEIMDLVEGVIGQQSDRPDMRESSK